MTMNTFDLDKEHEELFFLCLEDWYEEAKESGRHRACWFAKMRERGLRAKIAVDDRGVVGGMIQYLPIEQSFVDGGGLYFVPCIWVHGHEKGRGDFRGRGMGAELLKAAELGDKAVYTAVDTSEKHAMRELGYSDALFIDGKPVRLGPPPPYEKIRSLVAARVKKLPGA
jgi:hypothetical protein